MIFMSKGGVICALAVVLVSCGTPAKYENRAPKCSGAERRPLNRDLWDWQTSAPTKIKSAAGQSGTNPVTAPAPDLYPAKPAKMAATKHNYADEAMADNAAVAAVNALAAQVPAWNELQSQRACAEVANGH